MKFAESIIKWRNKRPNEWDGSRDKLNNLDDSEKQSLPWSYSGDGGPLPLSFSYGNPQQMCRDDPCPTTHRRFLSLASATERCAPDPSAPSRRQDQPNAPSHNDCTHWIQPRCRQRGRQSQPLSSACPPYQAGQLSASGHWNALKHPSREEWVRHCPA